MNAGGVLGRIAPAYLSDKLGRFNLLVPSAFVSGLSCLVFWFFSKSLVSIMLFSVFYGFVSGSFVSVVNPCVAQISDMSQMGTRIGMLYSIISVPWASLSLEFFILLPLQHGCCHVFPPKLYIYINTFSTQNYFYYFQISSRWTCSRRSNRSWSWDLQFYDSFLRFNYDIWIFLYFSC